jgi:hypothetical protein
MLLVKSTSLGAPGATRDKTRAIHMVAMCCRALAAVHVYTRLK